MKILHVVEAPGQGTGRHVIDLSTALRDLGHEVHIVFSTGRISPDFLAELRALEGIRIHGIEMRRRIGLSDISSGLALADCVRLHGPFDIIHGHSSKGGALARLVAAVSGTRCIYSPHCFATRNPHLSRGRRLVYGGIEHALGWITDALVACSPEERADAVSFGIARHKIFVVPHGIGDVRAVPRAAARAALRLSEDEICLGFIGRLVPQKAPDRVIRAFAGVRRRHAHARLVMVGAGELADELRRQAETAGIAESVIWTGEIPAWELFSAFDLVLMPSRYEGFSYSLLEAVRLGIPLVVSDVGGVSQAVHHGSNGVIVQQCEETLMAARLVDAVNELIEHPGVRESMAGAAKRRSENFTIERMAEQILLVYRSIGPSARPQITARRSAGPQHPSLADYRRIAARRPSPTSAAGRLVSIVIVTKNADATLARAITSVQAQTYPDIEMVVVDGGSTDSTETIARAAMRPQDYWFSEPDLGISDAFNKGIALARGEFVQLVGADDWLSPNQVAIAVERLIETGAGFAFGDGIGYEAGRPVFRYRGDPGYGARIDRWMPVIIHPSLMARRELYRIHGLFEIGLRSAMDYEWLLRVHRAGVVGVHDPRIESHIGLGGTHLRHYGRTMREVRQTAIAYGRPPASAWLEYGYHCLKHRVAVPLQTLSRPLYGTLRAWLNPAFEPLPRAEQTAGGMDEEPRGEPGR